MSRIHHPKPTTAAGGAEWTHLAGALLDLVDEVRLRAMPGLRPIIEQAKETDPALASALYKVYAGLWRQVDASRMALKHGKY